MNVFDYVRTVAPSESISLEEFVDEIGVHITTSIGDKTVVALGCLLFGNERFDPDSLINVWNSKKSPSNITYGIWIDMRDEFIQSAEATAETPFKFTIAYKEGLVLLYFLGGSTYIVRAADSAYRRLA